MLIFSPAALHIITIIIIHVVTILFIREVLLKKSIDTTCTRVVSVGIIVQYNICVVVVIMSVESFDRISNSVDNQKISSQKTESSGLSAAMHVPLIVGIISEFETPKVPVHKLEQSSA